MQETIAIRAAAGTIMLSSTGMTRSGKPMPDDAPNQQEMLLIVVGAHLEAERRDRPLAYRLREHVLRWNDKQIADDCIDQPLSPLVLTDVWYLNNEPLLSRPTIAVGDPEHNAATAFLASRLPVGFVIDNALQVHIDQEYVDLRACLWGVSTGAIASAVDLFIERYLDSFLRAAHELPIDS